MNPNTHRQELLSGLNFEIDVKCSFLPLAVFPVFSRISTTMIMRCQPTIIIQPSSGISLPSIYYLSTRMGFNHNGAYRWLS